MNYNPFAESYHGAKAQLIQLNGERLKALAEAMKYSEFDSEVAYRRLLILERQSIQYIKDEVDTAKLIETIEANVTKLKAEMKPWYNLNSVFNGERNKTSNLISMLQKQIDAHRSRLKQSASDVKNGSDEKRKLQALRTWSLSFDTLLNESQIKALDLQIQTTEESCSVLKKKFDKVESQVKDLLPRHSQLVSERSALERDIVKAMQLEEALGNASSGRERAQIHEECRDTLGEDRPANVAKKLTARLKHSRFELEKLEARILKDAAIAAREIQQIVIDGNNLCYDNSGFIGLSALLEVVDDLAATYSIIVIFDSDIRGLLKENDAAIRSEFPDYVEVHIVADKEKADLTVLSLAKEDVVYVISNDKYDDHPDQKAVQSKRIIKHEITQERVFVHELQVDRSYFAGTRKKTAR